MDEALNSLKQTFKKNEEALTAYQKQYNIRIQTEGSQ
jgi:hypothetical protein